LRNYYHAILTLRGGTFVGREGVGARGISNSGEATVLHAENVVVLAEDGGDNYALTNGSQAVAILLGGSFTGRGGDETRGIYNYNNLSVLHTEGTVVLGEGSSGDNRGLENASGQATLSGGSFTARGGTATRAINNRGIMAVVQATGVTALAEGSSTFNYGLYNADEAAAMLYNSAFTGRGGTSANGIYNVDTGTTLEAHETAALGEQASINNLGLYNSTDAEAILYDGSFTARNGGSGIQNYQAVLEAHDVFALGEGATSSYNQGLINTSNAPASATAILHGGSFIARGGTYDTRGIFTWGDNTTLQASGALIMAEDGDENYGIVINSGTADITQSTLQGSDYAAYRNITGGSVITISNSRLVDDTFGTITCVAVTAGTTFYENTCP
jgi:hypothetical protein